MPPRKTKNRKPETESPAGAEKYSFPENVSKNAPTLESEPLVPKEMKRGQIKVQGSGTAMPKDQDQDYGPSPKPHLHWEGRQYRHETQPGRPLYTHDKISAKTIISALTRKPAAVQGELRMDDDFNGLKEGHQLEPYQHEGNWHNRLIRADSRAAMRSLIQLEGMREQVNLIYFDPPYNKSFRSNFAPQADDLETEEKESSIPNDPVAIEAFRDTYHDGINSYLDGIAENLRLARELLAESGSIIVQIGPDNVHAVAMLMSEVFGAENHVATIPYRTGHESYSSQS